MKRILVMYLNSLMAFPPIFFNYNSATFDILPPVAPEPAESHLKKIQILNFSVLMCR